MALAEHAVVVQQACKIIGALAGDSATARRLLSNDVLRAVGTLIASPKQDSQLSALGILSSLADGSDAVAEELLTPDLLESLHALAAGGSPAVQRGALEAAGNLAFCAANKLKLLGAAGFMQARLDVERGAREWGGERAPLLSAACWIAASHPCRSAAASGFSQVVLRLAEPPPGPDATRSRTRTYALRTLAILGLNGELRAALRQKPIAGRGIRILCMDGGGMKGLAHITLLREIERRGGGAPLGQQFDLIVGTSTGAMLSAVLGILRFSLDECEALYRDLGHQARCFCLLSLP